MDAPSDRGSDDCESHPLLHRPGHRLRPQVLIGYRRRGIIPGILIQILNVIEMIPDIALLLLLIPLTGIGAAPTVTVAVLYSRLSVVRNTSIGIRSVRSDLIESRIALDMTERDIIMQIRLPLVLPLITRGMRTAVVYSMGIVTLGGIIGARGLGAVLQAGITRNNMTVILVAGVWIGFLAVIMDLVAASGEWYLSSRYGDRP